MTTETAVALRGDMTTMDLGKVLAASGYFADARQISQAVVKVLAGRELGLPPVASMSGINIIQGRPALSANVMAALVKRSGRYDYRVRDMTEKSCSIEFFETLAGKRESLGTSTFTAEEARKAGTKNMDKYARNMLFARAMSNGFRWFTPDLSGGPVYTPEELGAEVDHDGEVVSLPDAPPPRQDAHQQATEAEVIPEIDADGEPVHEEPAKDDAETERIISRIVDLGHALSKDEDTIAKAIRTAKTEGFGRSKAGKPALDALRLKWYRLHQEAINPPAEEVA